VSNDQIPNMMMLRMKSRPFKKNHRAQKGPLSWWLQNEAKYPRLAYLARNYLAVPASSATVERIFSRAGNEWSCGMCSLAKRSWAQTGFKPVSNRRFRTEPPQPWTVCVLFFFVSQSSVGNLTLYLSFLLFGGDPRGTPARSASRNGCGQEAKRF
jgi:hypothetical protein